MPYLRRVQIIEVSCRSALTQAPHACSWAQPLSRILYLALDELFDSGGRHPAPVLQSLVCVSHDADKGTEHDIDEEGDEGVQVEFTEHPDHHAFVTHLLEGGEHVVPVQ